MKPFDALTHSSGIVAGLDPAIHFEEMDRG
jgi:hypothetical protein